VFNTYKLWLVNGGVFALIMGIFFVDTFSGLSFIDLLVRGVLHTLWIIPLFLGANSIFCRRAYKDLFELWRARK
jgi:hypothetical protein